MTPSKRAVARKAKKAGKKGKLAKPAKSRTTRKVAGTKKSSPVESRVVGNQPPKELLVRERYVITVESIRGETPIGDLLVTFPRTREVLVRKGLKLEAEYAGDIYMTLDAFSAMNGLEVVNLVQEIVEVAKEPPTQPSLSQVVVPAVT